MSINDYNLDQQIKLIDLAEKIIELVSCNGASETILDRGHDTEDLFYIYEKVEEFVLQVKPEIFDQEDDE
jgi:hypothetical protein